MSTDQTLSKSSLSWPVREEIANISLHALGLFLACIGFGLLVGFASTKSSLSLLMSCCIYGVSLMSVFVGSILFHTALSIELPWKKALEVVDHCAIYLLVAGTYTPFLMVTLKGFFASSLLVLIWLIAFAGIAYKIFFFYSSDLLSTLGYLAMGWMAVLIVYPLFQIIGWQGIGMVALGGAFYSIGAIFYLYDHAFRFAHAIWHICVLLGSLCHYLTIFYFVVWLSK